VQQVGEDRLPPERRRLPRSRASPGKLPLHLPARGYRG
jgi:hypothetical protein